MIVKYVNNCYNTIITSKLGDRAMPEHAVAIFGESERGDYCRPYSCYTMGQLYELFGQPVPESSGIHFAIQILLHDFSLIFYRVREEGYSLQDYYEGLWQLENHPVESKLSAIGMPGVGNGDVIESVSSICATHHSILIMTESDLYDYLTDAV